MGLGQGFRVLSHISRSVVCVSCLAIRGFRVSTGAHCSSALLELTHYSEADVVGLSYTPVNLGAE